MEIFEFQDAYGQGYDAGYNLKGCINPFPTGNSESYEYDEGYRIGRMDLYKAIVEIFEKTFKKVTNTYD